MTTTRSRFVPTVFGSMCLVLFVWAVVTVWIEAHFGWPADRSAFGHRAIGWFVNLVLLRTFLRGMRRYNTLRLR